jgi:hypothetical protein
MSARLPKAKSERFDVTVCVIDSVDWEQALLHLRSTNRAAFR